MTQELLKILNPVRVRKVEDWIKAGAIVYEVDEREYPADAKLQAVTLIQRYEALTSQPLKKEMFVCEVEKPTDMYMGEQYYGAAMDEYNKAQEKVWFEGFERNVNIIIFSKSFEFYEDELIVPTTHNVRYYVIKNPTVSDFIIEIDRFNRTSSTPINISFTENFLNQLLR